MDLFELFYYRRTEYDKTRKYIKINNLIVDKGYEFTTKFIKDVSYILAMTDILVLDYKLNKLKYTLLKSVLKASQIENIRKNATPGWCLKEKKLKHNRYEVDYEKIIKSFTKEYTKGDI